MTAAADETSLPADIALGAVSLAVSDLDAVARFYERAIGLQVVERSDGSVRLGVEAGRPLVELVEEPGAPSPTPWGSGLFHLALLVPSRAELARGLRRVTDAGGRFTGASDHLVSEALYLNDPEGNGIEIYRDRPREEWQHAGGEVQMSTLALDLDAVMAELPAGDGSDGLPTETLMGHVHLSVADLADTEAFYAGVLGLDVTVRSYPGALFLSAGGYHHHLGVNTWTSAGAPAPPPGTRGLRGFEIVLAGADEARRAAERLARAGSVTEATDDAVVAVDPSGNRLRLAVA